MADTDSAEKDAMLSFGRFVDAAVRSDLASAHLAMSHSYREAQPESTTATLCQEVVASGILDRSEWRCMLVDPDHAYICPHQVDCDADYSPNVYGLERIDGTWFLSGEIVNERLGTGDE